MKIVINRSRSSGFQLSWKAQHLLLDRKATQASPFDRPADLQILDAELAGSFRITSGADEGRRRTDPDLVAVVEELGDCASAPGAKLSVVEVPDGVDWIIHEVDGKEQVALREEAAGKSKPVFSQPILQPVLAESFVAPELEHVW